MSDSEDARHGGGHARWERTGAQRHDAAYAEARAALLLGQMVHDRRIALGLTQAELASACRRRPRIRRGVIAAAVSAPSTRSRRAGTCW